MSAGGTDSASSTKSPCRYVTRLRWPRPDPRPRPLLPIPAQIRTLIHHTIHGLGVGYAEYGRERAEVIVDPATHLVCANVALRVDGEPVPHVAGWGEDSAMRPSRSSPRRSTSSRRRIENVLAGDVGNERAAAA